MCRVLQVSRSGYYAWRGRPESERAQEEGKLLQEIKAIHAESRERYGSPRLYREMRSRNVRCSENRVARLMRQEGIRARQARHYKATTDSKHSLPVAPNRLDRQFEAHEANTRWSGDITYIWTRQGWLYLAVVLDLYSRRVVGWSMQPHMESTLVVEALNMALAGRRPGGPLLCHSDRGSQYASHAYQEVLSSEGITCSMSRKGNCWDNAVVESFFSTLKRELVHGRDYATREEARRELFEYIEVFYNRKRRHSSLGYMTPAEYEAKEMSTITARAA